MIKIKKHLKDILLFIIILFLWLLSGLLFKYNKEYYELLKLPSFVLNGKVISIIWFIIYILNTISIIILSKKTNIFKNRDYLYILLTNYLANELFMYFFFYLMSPFLGFAITTVVALSTIFLFIETKKISKKSSYFLIPYIIYSIYAFILMSSVYFMNF
ncbi:MAG: tryptophan-rich sensory protein [Tenericutes bacterium]|nr:tryptophan-rich sensory protein [Mycoplasmatota bacterium]